MDITIETILKCIDNPEKRRKVLDAYNIYKEPFEMMKGSNARHHTYARGLHDHTLSTILIGLDYISKCDDSLKILFTKEDYIIAGVFHDFDKLDEFDTFNDVNEWLEDIGILNENIREGILHSHGAWIYMNTNNVSNNERFGSIGILLNFADMISTNKVTDRENTVNLNRKLFMNLEIMEYI